MTRVAALLAGAGDHQLQATLALLQAAGASLAAPDLEAALRELASGRLGAALALDLGSAALPDLGRWAQRPLLIDLGDQKAPRLASGYRFALDLGSQARWSSGPGWLQVVAQGGDQALLAAADTALPALFARILPDLLVLRSRTERRLAARGGALTSQGLDALFRRSVAQADLHCAGRVLAVSAEGGPLGQRSTLLLLRALQRSSPGPWPQVAGGSPLAGWWDRPPPSSPSGAERTLEALEDLESSWQP